MFPTHFFEHNTIIFFIEYVVKKSESSFIFYVLFFFCKIEYFGFLIMYSILIYYYTSLNDQFEIMVI